MSDFETWWEREGQEFLYALNTTTDDDIKLVAEVAWKNGAYKAEQQEPDCVVHNTDTPGHFAIITPALPAGTKLYIAPPQQALGASTSREWVEPSDEQIAKLWFVDGFYQTPTNFARAVLKLAKGLNNGTA